MKNKEKIDLEMFFEQMHQYYRDHPEARDIAVPEPLHEEKFLQKLGKKIIKVMVNIVPYLIKVFIATLVVWSLSFLIWKLFFHSTNIWMLIKSFFN